ncbi:hypothetical protein HCN44_001414 [Aphidius gifuensis]|uniref:Uncharacterized protein n=1 Tax=Aphidius gifuensis TaxID=684658 RepID=A0A835CQS3_APHGI|nr:hypothetical protein HCN44_001414 [Aphidius gifuensis]
MHGTINFTAGDIDDSHYFPRKKNSVCELRFTEWVESGDKSDYGKWRCCVNIVDSVEQTICQDIELPNEVDRPPKEGIGIYIFISIVIICLLALIGSCFYFIITKLKEKLEKKRKKKQRQSRRSRSSRRQRRARSASHQSRARSSNRQNQARSSSHPRQQTSSLPSSQQDEQASRIISARIQAEPNIYV